MNLSQYREHVLVPVLMALDEADPGQHSIAAEQLLLGTLMVESGGEHIVQLGGPARSLLQIEPETADDVHRNWLTFRPKLRRTVERMAGEWPQDFAGKLVMNCGYACAIARQVYRRDSKPLPPAGDAQAMGAYWKRVFNTAGGKGDPEHFAALFSAHVALLFVE